MLKLNKIALLLLIGNAYVAASEHAADTDEEVANKLDEYLVSGLMDGKPCT